MRKNSIVLTMNYVTMFHFCVLVLDVFAFWYDQEYLDVPFPSLRHLELPLKARPMFMTFWCFVIQITYFISALLNDIIGSNEANPRKKPLIRLFTDTLFSLAFPIAGYVTTTFWIIFFFNKDLVFPDILGNIFPTWLNHTMHSLVLINLFIELLITNRNYPSRKLGYTIVVLFSIIYTIWLHFMHTKTGVWAYPIFDVISVQLRAVWCVFSAVFGIAFYTLVTVLNVYSLWYDQAYLDFPYPAEGYAKMPFKGRQMFLTIWCFVVQTIYFATSFLNDIAGTNAPTPKKTPLIRSIKDTLFSLALPIALYVSTAFWGIYFVDKELVFPEAVSSLFPVWLNHTLHTLVTVFMFVELFITNRNYPSRKVGVGLNVGFSLIYTFWMHILQAQTGAWPYPIFEVLNLPQRIVYFVSSVAFLVGFYILGEKLNYAVATESSIPYVNGHIKKK